MGDSLSHLDDLLVAHNRIRKCVQVANKSHVNAAACARIQCLMYA